MIPTSLPPGALTALLHKYERLVQLRAQRDAHPQAEVTNKDELKALATAYPGCLRELDRLPLAGLQQRQAAVEASLAGANEAPWMIWIWGYHRLLAAALIFKGNGAPTSEAVWPSVSEAFLQQVKKPADGRISSLVLAELARQVEQPLQIVAAVLFPPRRPG